MSLFRKPQVILIVRDIERTAAFYTALGFHETFRVPPTGTPIHLDLELDGYTLGLATEETTREDHRLDPVAEGQRAVVVLWTDDVDAAYAHLQEFGGRPLHPPHPFLDGLRIAWVEDPAGHPVQVVQRVA